MQNRKGYDMRARRQIVNIDEKKCTGCGECITACAEGAIAIIDGKAKLVSDIYCDGLGACLGICPEDAITVEEREAEGFDEEAVKERLASLWVEGNGSKAQAPEGGHPAPAACPSAQIMDFKGMGRAAAQGTDSATQASFSLPHWPIKLRLVPPGAPFLQGADVVLTADCVPFAYANLHQNFLQDRAVLIGCPKFDDYEASLDRLTEILRTSDVRSLTVVHMEVPCCFGYANLCQQALKASGKAVPFQAIVVGIQGDVKGAEVLDIQLQ